MVARNRFPATRRHARVSNRKKSGLAKAAAGLYRAASKEPPDYCNPARLEEIAILESACRHNPRDARALYYLGNLLYDRRRHQEAIRLWERSAAIAPDFSIAWRNLGVGYFNVLHQPAKAQACYDRAFRVNATDARLLFERDQLWKRMGEKPEKRLRELERHAALVRQRDDLRSNCARCTIKRASPKNRWSFLVPGISSPGKAAKARHRAITLVRICCWGARPLPVTRRKLLSNILNPP